jgi:AcrR family transcriptional regulator
VRAALEVLAEAGPEFGLEQVAARAGISKPVVYRYYSDRAGLVAAMGERATAMLLERLVPALQADVAVLPRIRMSVGAFLAFADESPNVYRLLTRHAPDGGAGVARTAEEIVARVLAAVLVDAVPQLDLDAGVVEVWAHGVIGFVQKTTEWWLEQRTVTRDELTDRLTTLVWAQIDGLGRHHGVALDPDRRPARRPDLRYPAFTVLS